MSTVTSIRRAAKPDIHTCDLDARLEAIDIVVQAAFESIGSIPMSNPEFPSVNKALAFLNVAEREIAGVRAELAELQS